MALTGYTVQYIGAVEIDRESVREYSVVTAVTLIQHCPCIAFTIDVPHITGIVWVKCNRYVFLLQFPACRIKRPTFQPANKKVVQTDRGYKLLRLASQSIVSSCYNDRHENTKTQVKNVTGISLRLLDVIALLIAMSRSEASEKLGTDFI